MKLSRRDASEVDLTLLGEWNHQLIRDEGHRNPMKAVELANRMKNWLQGEYRAVIFSDPEPVAYDLFKTEDASIYLRQFFVRHERRRSGIGRSEVEMLRSEIWA